MTAADGGTGLVPPPAPVIGRDVERDPDVIPVPAPDNSRTRYVAAMDLRLVHPDPANIRGQVTDAGVEDMAASIREVGLIHPLVIRPSDTFDGYTIVAGHRRHRGVVRLGWTTVPVLVREPMPPVEVLEAMFAENNHREQPDPVAEATALRAIFQGRKLGSIPQLAIHVGRSVPWVSDRLALLDLPADVQARIRTGELTIRESVDRARVVRGLPPKRTTGRATSSKRTKAPAAPAPAAPAGVVDAIRAEAGALRLAAADFTSPTDAQVAESVADRLDALADRIGTGADPW